MNTPKIDVAPPLTEQQQAMEGQQRYIDNLRYSGIPEGFVFQGNFEEYLGNYEEFQDDLLEFPESLDDYLDRLGEQYGPDNVRTSYAAYKDDGSYFPEGTAVYVRLDNRPPSRMQKVIKQLGAMLGQ